MIFGVVTYYNESGPILRVECSTQEDYFRHLYIGADWVDSQPNRPLSVDGERSQPFEPANCE